MSGDQEVSFNLAAAEELLELFGGSDGHVVVIEREAGAAGPGLYAQPSFGGEVFIGGPFSTVQS